MGTKTKLYRKKVPAVDKKAREAVLFLASMCYHTIGDIGYRQIQELISEIPAKSRGRRK